MKRTLLRRISTKRAIQLSQLNQLTEKLRTLCDNRSELSRRQPDWQSNWKVEPHHIQGRIGRLLLDPLNIIMLTRSEHDLEEGKVKGEKIGKEKLLEIVKELRLRQGFVAN